MSEEDLKSRVLNCSSIGDKLSMLVLYGSSLPTRKKLIQEYATDEEIDPEKPPYYVLNGIRGRILDEQNKQYFETGELWVLLDKSLYHPRKDIEHIAKQLGVSQNEIKSSSNDYSLNKRILEICEIAIPPHEILGIKFVRTFLGFGTKDNEAFKDVWRLMGFATESFRLFEHLLGELIDFYIKWRFGKKKSNWDANLLVWLPKEESEKDSSELGWKINSLKSNKLNLGGKRKILRYINDQIQLHDEESEEFEKAFNRGRLLPEYVRIPEVPEETTDEHLNNIINVRNRYIHVGSHQLELFEVFRQMYEFVRAIDDYEIFPKVFRQLSIMQDWRMKGEKDQFYKYERLIEREGFNGNPRIETRISRIHLFEPETEFYEARLRYKGDREVWIPRDNIHSEAYQYAQEQLASYNTA